MANREQKNLEKALLEFEKSNQNVEKLANIVKKQQLDVKQGQAQFTEQGGTMKQFLAKQSPLFDKTFSFLKARKEGKEGGKVRNLLSAKTLGPAFIKGLSLGLLKFGVGGAIGAAKIIDVVDSYQDFSKDLEATRKGEFTTIIGDLIENENKSKKDVRDILKEQGVSNSEIGFAMDAYQDIIDERMKESIQVQIENGKTNDEIRDEIFKGNDPENQEIDDQSTMALIEEQRRTSEILETQNDIIKNTLEFQKQEAQNDDFRWKLMRDKEKEDTQDDGIFGSLLSGLGDLGAMGGLGGIIGGFKSSLLKAAPLIAGLGAAGLAAGTAFLAFKAGGAISKGIDNFTQWLTGDKEATLGGKIFEMFDIKDKKIVQDKFFATGQGKRSLKQAKKLGFKVTGQTTGQELQDFLSQYNEKQREMEVEKLSTSKMILENEKRNQIKKEELETEKINNQKKFQVQLEKSVQAQQQAGGTTIIDNTKRLDEIPTNSDDLTIAFLSKGSNL